MVQTIYDGHFVYNAKSELFKIDKLLKMFIDSVSDSSDSCANDVSPMDQLNNAQLTPLLLAIKEDCLDSVGKLVGAGCSLKIGVDSIDKTALHLAAKLNRAKCLEVIIDRASEEVIEQLKKILVLKNKFKLVPVMLTEDTACIEVGTG